MKTICILLVVSAVTVNAQTNQARASASPTNTLAMSTNWPSMFSTNESQVATEPETSPGPLSDEAFAARIIRNARETPMISNELQPNEIKIGRFTYSGITIEIAKMPNPLQLINPFAPPEYGSAEINLVRDPGGHPSGLKFFSIQF